VFNDDVAAKCPECGSADVSYSNEKIVCRACEFEETLQFDFQTSKRDGSTALDAINKSQALAVLQRWDFAG
jgi:ribosomal protein L37E